MIKYIRNYNLHYIKGILILMVATRHILNGHNRLYKPWYEKKETISNCRVETRVERKVTGIAKNEKHMK